MHQLGSKLQSTSLCPARRTSVSKRKMPKGSQGKGTDFTSIGVLQITVTPEQLSVHNKKGRLLDSRAR